MDKSGKGNKSNAKTPAKIEVGSKVKFKLGKSEPEGAVTRVHGTVEAPKYDIKTDATGAVITRTKVTLA